MPAVFISYSRRDKDFAAWLRDALERRKYEVWVDFNDIPPSAEWMGEIRAGVEGSDAFIYLISPDSVGSSVCAQELEHAVAAHKRIVPVLRRDPDGAAVPPAAAALNWIFLRDGDDWQAALRQLIDALEHDLDHVRTHTRLGVAAVRWDSGGREKSQLLRGAELSAAEGWLVAGADKDPPPTQLQREYVLASRQGATRRQRTVIGAVTLALIATIALAVVALVQRANAIHERNVEFAGRLDANAQNEYPIDPELSVLLAVKAAQVNAGTATEEALREALVQSHVRIRYTLSGPVPAPGDAIWSPDGTRLLVSTPGVGGWARIYTPGSDTAPVALGSAPASPGQSGWDARGRRVVIGGGQPAVYDASTGRLIARIPGIALFAALTSDGTRVVYVDTDFVGHVFDLATGRELAAFHPHYTGGVTCFALAPDDAVVAQCDTESLKSRTSPAALDTWSTTTGALLHSVYSAAVLGSVAFSPDSRWYVFTSPTAAVTGASPTIVQLARAEGKDGTLVYDTSTGQRVIGFPGAGSAAAFSPEAVIPELAYATLDDLGHVYNFISHQNQTLTGSTDVINAIRFDAYGANVITASNDGIARVYDSSTGGLPAEVLAGHKAPLVNASFASQDHWIATSSGDGTVRVWTGPTPLPTVTQPPSAMATKTDPLTSSLGFSAGGDRIIQASQTGQGQVLDAHTLKVLARFEAPAGQGFSGASESRDGRVIAALSGPLSKTEPGALADVAAANLYDPATGRLIATATPIGGGQLVGGALNHQGDELVTLDLSGAADIWDSHTGKLLHHLPGATLASGAAFSDDGSQLAIAHYPTLPATVTYTTKFEPVTIDVWNPRTGQHERTIVGHPLMPQEVASSLYAPLSVTFSPDGDLLAIAGADQGVELYNPHTGALAHKPLGLAQAPGGSFADSLAFSPNGELLAAGAASGAYVWRLPSYLPLPTFQHVATGTTAEFVGFGFGVQVGFSADSNYLLTSGDLVTDVWDVSDHLVLFHDRPVTRGALSPDATRIVTAGGAGVSLFQCDLCGGLDHLLTAAKRDTTRQLTRAEKLTYLNEG